MNKTFSLKKELLNQYAFKQIKSKIALIFIVLIFLSLVLLLVTKFYFILFIICGIFIFVGLIAFSLVRDSAINMAKALQITITENAIIKEFNKEKLGAFTNTSMELNKARFGERFELIIPFDKIIETEIDEIEINIYIKDSAFSLNDNFICIPNEIENFEEIKKHIKENNNIFKVK